LYQIIIVLPNPMAWGTYMLRTPWHGEPICCANRLC